LVYIWGYTPYFATISCTFHGVVGFALYCFHSVVCFVLYCFHSVVCTTMWKQYKTKHTTLWKQYKTKHTTLWKQYKTKHTTLFKQFKTKYTTLWKQCFVLFPQCGMFCFVLYCFHIVVCFVLYCFHSVVCFALYCFHSVVCFVLNCFHSVVGRKIRSVTSNIYQLLWNIENSSQLPQQLKHMRTKLYIYVIPEYRVPIKQQSTEIAGNNDFFSTRTFFPTFNIHKKFVRWSFMILYYFLFLMRAYLHCEILHLCNSRIPCTMARHIQVPFTRNVYQMGISLDILTKWYTVEE
jgi:hypothetical protein